MVLDFHVHTFPDAIAPRTLEKLSRISGLTPSTLGTLDSTRQKLREWGVDRAVLLNVATKPSQQTTINNCAAANQDEMFFCFGSIHPDAPDAIEELYRIRELGLRGVKLHPDYQNFFVNEDRMAPIYETLVKLSLPVVIHAGYDPLSPDTVHAQPKAIAEVVRSYPGLSLIGAHMGGMYRFDEVEEYLVGEHLYLDMSLACDACSPEQFERIVRSHGAGKILFGSDTPWGNSRDAIAYLQASGLTREEKDKIFCQNGLKLLGMDTTAAEN